MNVSEYDMPFRIVTNDAARAFVSGRDTQEKADARCLQANEDATILGIRARYIVITKEVK